MIVIGDVHGCLKTLQALIDKLPHANICLTGDLVDRGPDSAGVIKYIRENNFKTVKGNHEDMLLQTANEEHVLRQDELLIWWKGNGGAETLISYEKEQAELLEQHTEWLETLPLYIEYTNKKGQHYIISHSNINFAWNKKDSDPEEFEEWALWSRYFESSPVFRNTIGDSINIVGHTPQTEITEKGNIVFIDTGCVFHKAKAQGYGKLSAIDLETGKTYEQENIDYEI